MNHWRIFLRAISKILTWRYPSQDLEWTAPMTMDLSCFGPWGIRHSKICCEFCNALNSLVGWASDDLWFNWPKNNVSCRSNLENWTFRLCCHRKNEKFRGIHLDLQATRISILLWPSLNLHRVVWFSSRVTHHQRARLLMWAAIQK